MYFLLSIFTNIKLLNYQPMTLRESLDQSSTLQLSFSSTQLAPAIKLPANNLFKRKAAHLLQVCGISLWSTQLAPAIKLSANNLFKRKAAHLLQVCGIPLWSTQLAPATKEQLNLFSWIELQSTRKNNLI